MRGNVLLAGGQTIARWESKILEYPDAYKQLNATCTVIAVGPKCKIATPSWIGKRVTVGAINNQGDRLDPTQSEKCGLKPEWHYLAHESRIKVLYED